MNNKLKLFLVFIISTFWISCEDPDSASNNGNSESGQQNSSTIGQELPGAQGPIAELFFDLTNESLDYTYDFYSISGIGYANTIDLPCSIRETDVVNLYTFPDYLIEAQDCQYENCGWCNGEQLDIDLSQEECIALSGTWVESTDELVNADDFRIHSLLDETYGGFCSCWCVDISGNMVDCGSNNAVSQVYSQGVPGNSCQNLDYENKSDCESAGWVWFDQDLTGDGIADVDCSLMDANQDCVMEDAQDSGIINEEIAEFSVSYTNLEKLNWNVEAGRYKPQVSSEITEEVEVVDQSDSYDISRYWSIINEWENIDGKIYIDHSQWNDTTLVYEEEGEDVDITIEQTFEYVQSILNPDSLMFRIHSDCNNDGVQTVAETYEDVGIDGCPSIYETGDDGCACDFSLDPDLNECNSTHEICEPDSNNPLLCANGDDPNIDNWEVGLSKEIFTEDNSQYDCLSPYCNLELSQDFYTGEPFIDRVDNLPAAEVYWDIPIGDTEEGNGQWQGEELEPWADLNCNLLYDESADGTGNGVWDDDESYQDLNGNGIWDNNEPLYRLSEIPNQIIVNYDTDGNGIVNELDGPPEVIHEIDPDAINSAMVYLNNSYVSYTDIIKEESFEYYDSYTYTPIREVVTVFSNEIIEELPAPLVSNQYNIAKTYWPTLPDGTDVDGNGIADRFYDYDYHLFKYDDGVNQNLLKLIHPSYYYDPGFFETPDNISEGFFEISDLIEDIMIYVNGNNLRNDEKVIEFSVDSVDVTGDGVYNHVYDLTKEFEVSYEPVGVPLRSGDCADINNCMGTLLEQGETLTIGDETFVNSCSEGELVVCYDNLKDSCSDDNSYVKENDCGELIKEVNQCSKYKTLDTYKVIRTKTSVMHGSGVEYGERNTIWLAEGLGIVKDKLEIRWTGENGDTNNWTEYSRLELKSMENSNSGFNLGRMFQSGKIIDINNFENEGDFNNDPYIPKPTAIIQRVRTNND
tara:strand:+ start:1967 stop:4891 length:2925 start_codon:yes stop_codon:yes gene_type:complete